MGNIKIVSISMAFVFAFSSCGKTELPDNDNGTVETPSGGNTGVETPEEVADFRMSMMVTEANKSGRASVDENLPANGGQLQVRWDSGDKVRMMVGSSADDVKACDFSLVGGPSMGLGSFEYVGEEVQTNYYYGIYPPMEIGSNGEVRLNVPIDGTIRQAAEDDSRHLGKYRSMYAAPVQNAAGGNVLTGVVFKHLTSLIIFKVTNSTDETFNLSSIELSTSDGKTVFYSSASFNPQNQTEAVVNGNPSASVAFGFDDNGMQVTSQEMKKAYLPVLPTDDFSSSQLRVKAGTDKGEFITNLPIEASQTLKRFQAGSYCIFNLKKTTTGITVGMEVQGWEDGEIVDVPIL
ncbi:fimbrillin family protein [uncultured Bacteroides sp.]|uniref:fimbrillin family protein n=1 Tax=uncultured Bacteroides sp. TaxID=162156 RepID=UPI00262A4CA8|nr:fimbrillin family protein [uncultured Bacteroides sp.]